MPGSARGSTVPRWLGGAALTVLGLAIGTVEIRNFSDPFGERRISREQRSTGAPIQQRVKKFEGKQIDAGFTDGTRPELPGFAVSGVSFLAEDGTAPLADGPPSN